MKAVSRLAFMSAFGSCFLTMTVSKHSPLMAQFITSSVTALRRYSRSVLGGYFDAAHNYCVQLTAGADGCNDRASANARRS